MGVLDEAIREHLDLKRRRGADPGELEKQAAEALGPARREPAGEPPPEEVPVAEGEQVVEEEPVAPDEPVVEEEPLAEEEPLVIDEERLVEEPPLAEDEPAAEVTPLHPVEHAPPHPLDELLEPDEVPAEERMAEKPDDDTLWFEQSPRRDTERDE